MLLRELMKYSKHNPAKELYNEIDKEAFALLITCTSRKRLEIVLNLLSDNEIELLEFILATINQEMYFPENGISYTLQGSKYHKPKKTLI